MLLISHIVIDKKLGLSLNIKGSAQKVINSRNIEVRPTFFFRSNSHLNRENRLVISHTWLQVNFIKIAFLQSMLQLEQLNQYIHTYSI